MHMNDLIDEGMPFELRFQRMVQKANLSEATKIELDELSRVYRDTRIFADRYRSALELKEFLAHSVAELHQRRMAFNSGKGQTSVDRPYLPEIFEELQKRTQWEHIVARDALMSVYHFQKALEEFDQQLFKGPVKHITKANVSKPRWFKVLGAAFPNLAKLRNTIAHEAEQYVRSQNASSNSLMGPTSIASDVEILGEGSAVIRNLIAGDDLVFSRDNSQLTFSFNEGGFSALTDCLALMETYLMDLVKALSIAE